MPTLPTDQIVAFAKGLRAQCEHLNLRISGTGAFNDFADPDPARRALDIQRVQFWTDIAAVMGAPVIRVFSGVVPVDLDAAGGWAAVTQARIVPALQQVTAYAATKGVRVLLQNHGDMTATADQTIQMLQWVGDPNISIIDDTGYFRPVPGRRRSPLQLLRRHRQGRAVLGQHPGQAQARRRDRHHARWTTTACSPACA